MRVNVNLNPPQPRANAQDLMMIGRPGRPVMMQKFVANRLRGFGRLGAGDLASQFQASAAGYMNSTGTNDPYQGITAGTSTPPNVYGYSGPLILPLNYQQVNGFASLPTVPAPYYWAISQPYLGANGISTYYYIVMGPDGPGFTMPGNPPILPLSAAAGLANQVNQTIANPGVTQDTANPNATVATLTYGGGSGTQGGGSNVLSAAPASSSNTLPNSQTSIQTANTTGTSGGATGNLVNGQPAAGSNINPELLPTGTGDINFNSLFLIGGAALLLLLVVK